MRLALPRHPEKGRRVLFLILAAPVVALGEPPPPPPPPEPTPVSAPNEASLAAAGDLERQTIDRLLDGGSWTRRALAAMRLELYRCDDSRAILFRLAEDESWQVRTFAIRALGRRHESLPEDAFGDEYEPKVLRAALRHGFPLDTERVGRGVRYLSRSGNLHDKMLAVELGIASGDEELARLARRTVRTIILRMGRGEAGTLSPRLAAVTGAPDLRRHYRWRKWLRKAGNHFPLHAALATLDADTPPGPGQLASLDSQQFADLEGYIDDLGRRSVDLGICLDCTASMSAELSEAQGGIDDLMIFVGDVVLSLRVAIVGYRDRRDEFLTRAWDFTTDIDVARGRLWSLAAAGGGDTPEAVYPALKLAYSKFSWHPDHTKVLVLIGDAPPHVGLGTPCIEMAARASRNGLTTHVIEADTRHVKHFAEIAEAGRGRCVSMPAGGDVSLIAEIAGLTLGERFETAMREFFQTYLALCR